ncbi:uncharacterized protein Dana_GF18808 [Drosophila ananassae]|uniref:Uncharacterized protein n=1 Tax=Drosophila ananassae TaxID=7217 RepID=B3LYV4_DROAN|nr:uncharacterized protein LOC6501577 [Drosophila ananassae]EDV44070.1 uncharacterized protein Dana_GF18808 [Drosophila ananassae]
MSLGNADPWQVKNSGNKQESAGPADNGEKFEDNFSSNGPETNANGKSEGHEPLPDSSDYLKLLERKLAKVQKGNKLLDSLRDKRQDCMRGLLASEGVPVSIFEQFLELETPIESGRLHRHLLPIQAVNVGETVHIVDHDELQQKEEDNLEQDKKALEL